MDKTGQAISSSGGGKRVALHQRIYALLRREISSTYSPGDILPSQNELAKRFKVSFLTVRESLSILAEEGVIERRRGRDTVVIDPAGGQHVAILLELDVADPRTTHHFRIAAQRARSWLREQGFAARHYIGIAKPDVHDEQLFSKEGTTCPELIDDVEAGRVRGVVAIAGPTPALARYLAEHSIPVVGDSPNVQHRVVAMNIDRFVKMAIDYLVACGRRELAFMTWGQPSAIIKHARAAGLELNLNWLRCDLPPAAQGSGWEEFREIWTSERRRPDGIVITDNVLFEDALHAMIESKVRVPEELLVVTHASKGVEPWTPFPVTRIEVDAARFAETASQLLVDMMLRRQKTPALIELPCELVEPESSPTSVPPGRGRRKSGPD